MCAPVRIDWAPSTQLRVCPEFYGLVITNSYHSQHLQHVSLHHLAFCRSLQLDHDLPILSSTLNSPTSACQNIMRTKGSRELSKNGTFSLDLCTNCNTTEHEKNGLKKGLLLLLDICIATRKGLGLWRYLAQCRGRLDLIGTHGVGGKNYLMFYAPRNECTWSWSLRKGLSVASVTKCPSFDVWRRI